MGYLAISLSKNNEKRRDFYLKIKKVRGSITYRMKNQLREQWDAGRGQSRHDYKRQTGRNEDYDRIYSQNSYKKHMSSVNTFGNWLKAERPEIKRLEQIDERTVASYLQARDVERSAFTVSADLNAINRVLVGSKSWERPLTKDQANERYGVTLRDRRLQDITNSRTPSNYLERYRDTYRREIDMASSFGLRRSEICSQEKGVTQDSLYYSKEDEKLYVTTIGKGGRHRVAQCLEERKEEMIQRYEPYIQYVDTKEQIPDSDETKAIIRNSEHLFSEKISNNCTLHRFRADYAENLVEELKIEHEGCQSQVMMIGDVEAVESVFLEVSQNLGHNRLDVLKNYLHNVSE